METMNEAIRALEYTRDAAAQRIEQARREQDRYQAELDEVRKAITLDEAVVDDTTRALVLLREHGWS